MQYGNTSGNSNITDVVYGNDWIEVTFKDGATYRYTSESCAQNMIDQMKQYADSGSGLNGFIGRNRPGYESRS